MNSGPIPVASRTLANGLTVVVSEDHRSPVVGVSMLYKVGMRLEPRGRAGFAHLFEHLMFEGTPTSPKGVMTRVVEGGGGWLNGWTRPDFTHFQEKVPASALEPVLWLEADRMKTLDFSPRNLQNQRDVVKEEIRVNVRDQPFGMFYWLDLSALAFDRWENRHDAYGSFEDLDNAAIQDVEAFHRQFYAPNNAVLCIAGDVRPEQAFTLAETHFGKVPARTVPPPPDVAEGRATAERRTRQSDPLARIPGLAIAWRMPACGTPDHVPAVALAELMAGGEASRLNRALIRDKALAVSLEGQVNWPLSTPWSYGGPTLFVLFATLHPGTGADGVLAVMDAEIGRIAREGVPEPEVARLRARLLSRFFAGLEDPMDRADALAIAQALNGGAAVLNTFPDRIQEVTSADLKRVAATYLTRANRSVIERVPVN